MNVKKLILTLPLIFLICSSIVAQTPTEHRGQGYVFVGPGASSGDSPTMLNFGVGGEGFVYKGLGVGAEIGGFVPVSEPDAGVGVFSPNISYHFPKASNSGKLVPFVTGGYSLFFRSNIAHAANFGGGVNYWFKDRVGLRVEVRDHVLTQYSDVHYVGFRFGLAFR
jgi:hypothetical protein